MKNIKFSLAWQILFAMVLGILLGSYLHYHSDSRDWLVVNLLSPAGDIFIHLIKNDCCADCDLHAGGGYRGCW